MLSVIKKTIFYEYQTKRWSRTLRQVKDKVYKILFHKQIHRLISFFEKKEE